MNEIFIVGLHTGSADMRRSWVNPLHGFNSTQRVTCTFSYFADKETPIVYEEDAITLINQTPDY